MESKPTQVKNGTRTYLINGDFIKFHTVFKDGSEIVEEYGIYSEELGLLPSEIIEKIERRFELKHADAEKYVAQVFCDRG